MPTDVLKLLDGESYSDSIARAADVLAGGGLVAFPTETVYGVGACAASAEGIRRLRHLKDRPAERPFTVHLGTPDQFERFVPQPSLTGRRLVSKGWPGPLTLIFDVPDFQSSKVAEELPAGQIDAVFHKATVGLRCPDNSPALDLLSRVAMPVVAASANRAAQPPALCAEDVVAELNGQIDLVLDGGMARYAKPSTIVRVNGESYDIIREGVFDQRTLRRLASLTLLFVCTGNTCRSPMAAAWCTRLLSQQLGCPEEALTDRGYAVCSAGTMAGYGMPSSSGASTTLAAHGLDLSSHRSQPLSVELIQQADYIFTMNESHREWVLDLAPAAASRTQLLDASGAIEDPVGGGDEFYDHIGERIRGAVEKRLSEVLA